MWKCFPLFLLNDLILSIVFCRMLLDHKIIVLADGIHGNVIKYKPPMVVTKEDCDHIIQAMDAVLTKLT